MEFQYLTIRSSNADAYGDWRKDEVEADMRDLGVSFMSETAWIEWIIDHALSEVFIGMDLVNAILSQEVDEIKFTIGSDWYRIVKSNKI